MLPDGGMNWPRLDIPWRNTSRERRSNMARSKTVSETELRWRAGRWHTANNSTLLLAHQRLSLAKISNSDILLLPADIDVTICGYNNMHADCDTRGSFHAAATTRQWLHDKAVASPVPSNLAPTHAAPTAHMAWTAPIIWDTTAPSPPTPVPEILEHGPTHWDNSHLTALTTCSSEPELLQATPSNEQEPTSTAPTRVCQKPSTAIDEWVLRTWHCSVELVFSTI